ncbi:MAG: hypothetical protein CSB32_01090 [Desulfobacterales bacterium]|nr:MAG: hypothetical protein CSB32_01090 [Desulfobacterales bacterium]
MSLSLVGASSFALSDLLVPADLQRGLRRADDFIRLAVVASEQVLRSVDEQNFSGQRCALVLGSSFATMQTSFDFLDFVVLEQDCSPTLFSHSVFNAAAGYIGSCLNITGPALTVIDFSLPFFKALQEAETLLAGEGPDYCLLLQVETYSELLVDRRQKIVAGGNHWPPGVVCWLLQKPDRADRRGCLLEKLKVEPRMAEPRRLLAFEEQLFWGRRCQHLDHPLAAAMALTAGLAECGTLDTDVTIEGEQGRATMRLEMQSPLTDVTA